METFRRLSFSTALLTSLFLFVLAGSPANGQEDGLRPLRSKVTSLAHALAREGFAEAAQHAVETLGDLGAPEATVAKLRERLEAEAGEAGEADGEAAEVARRRVVRAVTFLEESLGAAGGGEVPRIARAILALDSHSEPAGTALGYTRSGDGRYRPGEELARVRASERLAGAVAAAWRAANRVEGSEGGATEEERRRATAMAVLGQRLVSGGGETGGEAPPAGSDGLEALAQPGVPVPAPFRQGHRDVLAILLGIPGDGAGRAACWHDLRARAARRLGAAEDALPLTELFYSSVPLDQAAAEDMAALVAWLHATGSFAEVAGRLLAPGEGQEGPKERLERAFGQPLEEVEAEWRAWLGAAGPDRGSVLDLLAARAGEAFLAEVMALRGGLEEDPALSEAASALAERLAAAKVPRPLEPVFFAEAGRFRMELDLAALHGLRFGVAAREGQPGAAGLAEDARMRLLLGHPGLDRIGVARRAGWEVIVFPASLAERGSGAGVTLLRLPEAPRGVFGCVYGVDPAAWREQSAVRLLDGGGEVPSWDVLPATSLGIPSGLAAGIHLLSVEREGGVRGLCLLELHGEGARDQVFFLGGDRLPEARLRGRPARNRARSEAIRAGVEWLLRLQQADGSWSDAIWDAIDLAAAPELPDPSKRSWAEYGTSALALLALIRGEGEVWDPRVQISVERGLGFLLRHRRPDGRLGWTQGTAANYENALALQVFAEYGLAQGLPQAGLAEVVLEPAVRGLCRAQNPYSGWGYALEPDGRNNSSLTAWCGRSLLAVRMMGVEIDERVFDGTSSWLMTMADPTTGRVGYAFGDGGGPGGMPARLEGMAERYRPELSESLTAEALAFHLGLQGFARGKASREAAALREVPERSELWSRQVELLVRKPPVWDVDGGSIDLLYWWYGTEALVLWGGEPWERWSGALDRALLRNQRRDGAFAGSWDPVGAWTAAIGGRVMSTALAVLSLETGPTWWR